MDDTFADRQFWRQVYVACIARGCSALVANGEANQALTWFYRKFEPAKVADPVMEGAAAKIIKSHDIPADPEQLARFKPILRGRMDGEAVVSE